MYKYREFSNSSIFVWDTRWTLTKASAIHAVRDETKKTANKHGFKGERTRRWVSYKRLDRVSPAVPRVISVGVDGLRKRHSSDLILLCLQYTTTHSTLVYLLTSSCTTQFHVDRSPVRLSPSHHYNHPHRQVITTFWTSVPSSYAKRWVYPVSPIFNL